MVRTRTLRLVVIVLLAAIGMLLAFLCVPDTRNADLNGLRGYHEDGRLVVATVYQGSPAAVAGLEAGDIVTARNGRSVADWYAAYQFDRDLYFRWSREAPGSVRYDVRRGDREVALYVTPRTPGVVDVVRLHGVRLAVALLLVALLVVIARARTREPAAVLISLQFGFAALWLVSDVPDWWEFFSAVTPGLPSGMLAVKKILELLFLQLAVALLLHVALVFPVRHALLERFPRLLAVNYLLPALVFGTIIAASGGGVLDRLAAAHDARLSINTAIMLTVAGVMLSNYRLLPSPADRAQMRWIVLSLLVFLGFHLLLWNFPKLFLGHALVPDYEWVLVPMMLIPAALTMSILNHELFGIRGILRGRILLLKTMLEREKSMVVSRDHRINEMTAELAQLNAVLKQYRHAELEDGTARGAQPSRLEERYPEITAIRRDRLLGASPKWDRILERAVVAARGSTPVLVVGESGTGKTNLAWTLYRLGDRREKVYREISCAQFEHADPAFALGRLFGIGSGHGLPNAPREGRPGLLEECNGGTLFLDDVDRLPLSVQDMLLYPLEGRPFEPGVGAGPSRTVSIKFILATNRDPDRLVEEGGFRGDVLARIGERIDVPPLRERPEDIPVLVEHFLRAVCRELGHEITVVSPMAMNLLARYPYDSGNARELQMEIRTAAGRAMLEGDKVLRAGYLSDRLRLEPSSKRRRVGTGEDAAGVEPVTDADETLAVLRRHEFRIRPAEAELGYSHKSRTLSNRLRGMCLEAASLHGWDAHSAAASLAEGCPPAVVARLRRKIERYMENVGENVARRSEDRLYRNLPVAYHGALRQMIEHVRGSPPADRG